MRHKYQTQGICIGRREHGEANVVVSVLTRELGLVRARVQGVRKTGAKLASGIRTLSVSTVTLVRGKEGWRLVGALLESDQVRACSASGREVLGRVASLIERLAHGESSDVRMYDVYRTLMQEIERVPDFEYDTYEYLTLLYILTLHGVEGGEGLEGTFSFSPNDIDFVKQNHKSMISRINAGIHASGL